MPTHDKEHAHHAGEHTLSRRFRIVVVELAHHLPYTIISSLIAMAAIWYFGTVQEQQAAGQSWVAPLRWSFHVLHPLHVCLSAITTTAVLWRFERKLFKALAVGTLGSVIPCGFSDYVVPFVGGRILGQPMELHMCLIEHPMLILPFLLLGLFCGFLFEGRVSNHSIFSHGAHVFVSSLAALLYLAGFGFTGWMTDFTLIFPVLLVVVTAVWIPCCIGDIVVPVSAIRHYPHGGRHSVPRPSV